MNRRIDADGSPDSKYVIIGEAPGTWELKQGKPFVGPAGRLLNYFLYTAGLHRRDFYILNVFPYMAPNSKIELVKKDEVTAWADTLHQRLSHLTDPWLVVPTGNIALRAWLKKPLYRNDSPKISDWRGSIIGAEWEGRIIKTIPTIHPAAVLRAPSLGKLCRMDWKRIASDGKFRELRLPKRTRYIPPIPFNITKRLLELSDDPSIIMSIDIETTPKLRRIDMVGFSPDPRWSATYKWPEDKALIKRLCGSKCQKVGQNFLYDRFWLYWQGVDVKGEMIFDTLSMHHSRDSTLPHSLAEMASLDTRQPYWKKSSKDFDEDLETADRTKFEDRCLYNGIDCVVTRELFDVYDPKRG